MNNFKSILRKTINECFNYLDKKKNFKILSLKNKEIKIDIDHLLQEIIFKNLNKTKIPIISEEKKNNFQKLIENEYTWIIDPLDGSFNKTRKIDIYCISIGLFKKNNPYFGMIGHYPTKSIYHGGKNFGSYKNSKKINVSSNKINNSVLATGFPYNYDFKNFSKYKFFFKKFTKIRMFGSASYSLALLAEGKVDAYFESNINIWDIAAGLAIVQGAGGKINLKSNNQLVDTFVTNKIIRV